MAPENRLAALRKGLIFLLLIFVLGTELRAALPFLFWLPSASRSNASDPKSSLFVAPTAVAISPKSPTPTFTPSPPATPASTPTPTATATATPGSGGCTPPDAFDVGTDPTVFEDFEAQPASGPPGPYYWDGGPSAIVGAWDSSSSATCTYSYKFVMGAGSGYGHWYGFTIDTPSRSYPSATTSNLSFWYKVTAPVMTAPSIIEGSSAGGDGEAWVAPNVSLTVSASWQQVVVPLSSFSITGTPAGGVMDLNDIATVWFYNQIPYSAHTIWLDDIKFTP
jgi:hypothetical protein